MAAHRILVTARSFARTAGPHLDLLHAAGCELNLQPPEHPLSSAALAHADALRVISRYGVGVDEVDLDAAAARGIAVTSTPNTNTIGVAELAIALMFALARHIPRMAAAARAGEWTRHTGWELTGKTLGLIGFGAIGHEVARRALGLGMRVLAYDPYWRDDLPGVAQASLDQVFAESDIVSLHSALTPQTANLVDAARLAAMRPTAVLINTARGGLVDEDALYQALREGRLAGAAFDAFAHEPPQASPLLALDNFIATPHAGATTRESIERMALLAAQNCLAILRGEPCPYLVNRAALAAHGYSFPP